MKKRIIIIIFVFFLTGCSASYNLEITEDLKIKEDVYLIGKTSEFTSYGNSLTSTFDNIIKVYQENNLKPKLNLNSIDYSNVDDSQEYLDITLTRNYKNFDKYKNSDILINCFKSYDIVEENKQYKLYINGINWDTIDQATSVDKYDFIIDTINVKITLPFKVLSSNADYQEEDTNTYIWAVNRETTNEFEIRLDFSKKDKFVKQEGFITNAINAIVTTITGSNDQEKNEKIKIFIIIGFVLILGGFIYYIAKKIYKNNNSL